MNTEQKDAADVSATVRRAGKQRVSMTGSRRVVFHDRNILKICPEMQ